MAQSEFDISLAELEVRLERLRSLYEQYFLGIERIEPAVARKDVDRRIWAIRKIRVNNTAKRFRLQGIIQRYNTLQQYWGRICRQIENGTYRRHVARAERRFGSADGPARVSEPPSSRPEPRESQLPPSMRENALRQTEMDLGQLLAAEIDADAAMRDALDAAFSALGAGEAKQQAAQPAARRPKPASPPRRAQTPGAKQESGSAHGEAEATSHSGGPGVETPAPAASGSLSGPMPTSRARKTQTNQDAQTAERSSARRSSGVDSAKLDALYDQLVAAKRQLNPSSKVNKETLARSLRQTEATLLAKHAGRTVDFRVEIREGKAQIKPIVK